VNKNALLDVQETIVYVNAGKRARGIYGDYSTVYYFKNKMFKQIRDFKFISVVRDGKPENYHIERVSGGYRLYVGNKDIYLKPGKYTYKIFYKTSGQIGFFEKYDELYWNVNGTGFRMPIEKIYAKVILPQGIDKQDIVLVGYTGHEGEDKKDYEAGFDKNGVPVFTYTKSFDVGENLSISVGWPKGFVMAPSALDKIIYFLKDNIWFVFSLILFFIFFIWSIMLYVRKKRTQIFGTVIPLFYPPKSLTPADVRYIYKMGYDAKVFAAEIINMAVNGLITIKYEKNKFFGGGSYTLFKTKEVKTEELANLDFKNQENFGKYNSIKHWYLLDLLFRNMSIFGTSFTQADSIKLDKSNSKIIREAVEKLQTTLKNSFQGKCFLDNTGYAIFGGIIGLLITMLGVFSESNFIWGLFLFYACVLAFFSYLLRGYKPEGLKIKTEIDGFKLFLATTETDRLKVIGTPPTRTPELYEKYLPYAVALGVEKQWSKQFAPVFEVMKEQGHPYVPIWYIGMGDFGAFDTNAFATDLSAAATDLSKNLSGVSGSSGGGSSGGGGGRSGGGSW
jgi:Predicted membrane protein